MKSEKQGNSFHFSPLTLKKQYNYERQDALAGKHHIMMLLALAMPVSLTSCGGDDDDESGGGSTPMSNAEMMAKTIEHPMG